MPRQVSAGLVMFRRRAGQDAVEVLLVHPGGPWWRNRDAGAWTIPKGQFVEGEEDPLAAAAREFREETGLAPPPPDRPAAFLPLGAIRQKGGKSVHAWAFEGDCDPSALASNTSKVQWPPKSGAWRTFPEVDDYGWFMLDEARQKINAAQFELLERLDRALRERAS